MMYWLQTPQLMQTVATKPRALYGIERLNRGYRGPVAHVWHGSAEADCYSLRDIQQVGGVNRARITILYDQSGNGLNFTYYMPAQLPYVYEPATGVIRLRASTTPALSFTGPPDNDAQVRNAGLGLAIGQSAKTTATVISDWGEVNPAWPGPGTAWCVGPEGGNQNYSLKRPAAGQVRIFSSPGHRTFACVDTAAITCDFVTRRALGASIAADEVRQNGGPLTQLSVVDGAPNFANAATWIARHDSSGNVPVSIFKLGLWAVWDAYIAGGDLAALERFLRRMRVA